MVATYHRVDFGVKWLGQRWIFRTVLSACKCGPDDVPRSPIEALRFSSGMLVSSIRQLLLLSCTWPVTTCSCQRSISALRRLKTYLRSTMGQERLVGLALLHTHYDMIVNIDDVIKIFAQKNSRRIVLPGLGERGWTFYLALC